MKVNLSHKKVEEIKKEMVVHLEDQYDQLQGRLLTTFEAVMFPNEQLKALKERIKSIQGAMWDEVFRQKEESLSACFIFVDEETIEAEKDVLHSKVENFLDLMRCIIQEAFDGFEKRLKNFTRAIFFGMALESVEREINMIINRVRYNLTRFIDIRVRGIFGYSVK